MASSVPHWFYSKNNYNYNYTCPLDNFYDDSYPCSVITQEHAMWGQDGFVPLIGHNGGVIDGGGGVSLELLDYDDMAPVWPSSSPSSFQEPIGNGSEMDMPAFSDYKTGFYNGTCTSGEDCCGFIQDFKLPPYPAPHKENWGDIRGNQTPIVEESNIKVGRYTEEERKERILRYLKKRNQRNFNKTIKYACRKTLADRRARVRGRFARNTEACEEEIAMKNNNNHHKQDMHYEDANQQLKPDEDDWLQEAMSSLVYLLHSSPGDI